MCTWSLFWGAPRPSHPSPPPHNTNVTDITITYRTIIILTIKNIACTKGSLHTIKQTGYQQGLARLGRYIEIKKRDFISEFFQKVYKNDKFKHMFPEKVDEHKTRNNEKQVGAELGQAQ